VLGCLGLELRLRPASTLLRVGLAGTEELTTCRCYLLTLPGQRVGRVALVGEMDLPAAAQLWWLVQKPDATATPPSLSRRCRHHPSLRVWHLWSSAAAAGVRYMN
jgi:hypothetical protein